MKPISCLLLLLLSLPRWSQGQSAAVGLYEQANQAYAEGRYPQAIESYRKIIETGMINGAVFYNLGNAYFKDNQLGRAILSYERARRLLPRDPDVSANLALANQLTADKITTNQSSLWGRVAGWLMRSLNIAELTRGTFLLYLITAIMAVAAIWAQEDKLRRRLLLGCLIFGVFFAFSAASLGTSIYQHRVLRWAIALEPSIDARSGPGHEYTKIFALHEGTKIRIRQEREGWLLISLPNALGGWIPKESAEVI